MVNITQEMQEQQEVKDQETKESKETVKEKNIDAKEAPKFLTETFLKPERIENETQEHYRMRQKANQLYLKYKKKGQLMWLAKDISSMLKGTTFNKKKYIEAVKKFEEAQKATQAAQTK